MRSRKTPDNSTTIREFRSGMVGIAKDQILRINAVNTGPPGVQPRSPAIRMGLIQNPSSELAAERTMTLKPGASGYLDVDFDDIESADTNRHQVRAVITVNDDPASVCQVTVEVFDRKTGKTMVFVELREEPKPLTNLASSGA